MIDDIDRRILTILQQDARASNVEIAQEVGLTPSAVFERVKKLEKRGVIRAYEARLNPQALEVGLLAFIFVRAQERFGAQETGEALAHLPEVLEVHHIAGEDCYLVKVRAANTEALGRLLREKFGAIEHINATRTTIVLSSIKEEQQLPLAGAARREDEVIE